MSPPPKGRFHAGPGSYNVPSMIGAKGVMSKNKNIPSWTMKGKDANFKFIVSKDLVEVFSFCLI